MLKVHDTSPEKVWALLKVIVRLVVSTADAETLLQVTDDVDREP